MVPASRVRVMRLGACACVRRVEGMGKRKLKKGLAMCGMCDRVWLFSNLRTNQTMKHEYAISVDTIYQKEGNEWACINDETAEFDCYQDSLKVRMTDAWISENPFVRFEDEADCIYMIEHDRPYLVREFIEQAAQTYLVDRDNGGVFA